MNGVSFISGKNMKYQSSRLFNFSEKHQSRKIVSLEVKAGYGNHLYSILTSMTIALLTDRKFQMNWPEIEQFINEPSNNTFIKNLNMKHYLINPKENSGYKPVKNIHKILSTNVSFADETVFFGNGIAYFMEVCSNPGYFEKLVNSNLTQYSTVENALKLIKKNATHDDLIDGIYKIGYEVGGNLLNRYWIPKPSIMTIINDFVKKEFKPFHVIGIQIRTHYLIIKKDLERFIQCSEYLEKNYFNSTKPIKWYLSSDSQDVINTLKGRFPEKIIFGQGEIKHISEQKAGHKRAIIDVELLSRTDILVLTGVSTFGFISSMKSKRFNYVVDAKSNETCHIMIMSNPGRYNNWVVV